jgi:hypothetical protein
MALYPSDPRPETPYNFRVARPFVIGGPQWAPQMRGLTRFNLLEVDLLYHGKSWAQIKTLYDFWESVDGCAGRFTFVDFNGIGPIGSGGPDPGTPWSGLYVAKGDAVASTWDLPTYAIVAGSSPVVYENGSAKTTAIWTSGTTTPTAGTYLIIPGTGTDGVDTLKAGTVPASTVIITIDATCRRAMRRACFSMGVGGATTYPGQNPFVLNVASNYYQGPLTIVELRK